jgi:hypothetical protein
VKVAALARPRCIVNPDAGGPGTGDLLDRLQSRLILIRRRGTAARAVRRVILAGHGITRTRARSVLDREPGLKNACTLDDRERNHQQHRQHQRHLGHRLPDAGRQ